ncbi:lipoprotein, partial [Dokdonella sp.]
MRGHGCMFDSSACALKHLENTMKRSLPALVSLLLLSGCATTGS